MASPKRRRPKNGCGMGAKWGVPDRDHVKTVETAREPHKSRASGRRSRPASPPTERIAPAESHARALDAARYKMKYASAVAAGYMSAANRSASNAPGMVGRCHTAGMPHAGAISTSYRPAPALGRVRRRWPASAPARPALPAGMASRQARRSPQSACLCPTSPSAVLALAADLFRRRGCSRPVRCAWSLWTIFPFRRSRCLLPAFRLFGRKPHRCHRYGGGPAAPG